MAVSRTESRAGFQEMHRSKVHAVRLMAYHAAHIKHLAVNKAVQRKQV